MKQVDGITRVTLRKRDGMIFVVNDPQVLRSENNGNSFAVLGELSFDDPSKRMQAAESQKYVEAQRQAMMQAQTEKYLASGQAKAEPKKDDGEPLSEEGITAGHINIVMDHTNCSRNEAIQALRDNKDDMISAVMALTK